ncbi:hypothetical protein K440DRAFT_633755 [Wilcoxina mikolae CBS 423.85]|nr:hypothetical protein K440DRAFT_633755 [Wilcoxina mikolae CBS 423.85]
MKHLVNTPSHKQPVVSTAPETTALRRSPVECASPSPPHPIVRGTRNATHRGLPIPRTSQPPSQPPKHLPSAKIVRRGRPVINHSIAKKVVGAETGGKDTYVRRYCRGRLTSWILYKPGPMLSAGGRGWRRWRQWR